jgi:tetratricopeptide (TPR) repeat protein
VTPRQWSPTGSKALVALLLAAATFAIFSRAGGNEFLLYDDAQYITLNPQVAGGLTLGGARWAFTSFYAFNWHPLTWISHMLDTSLFGLSPRGPHLVNALLHAASAAALLIVLERMTGALWGAALVAAGFALHPLHVQSVAWAAERKDVLSAFFWIATMGAWSWYAHRPRPGRYLVAASLLMAGLLAKPMVVTLPLVLILMDFWPLGRTSLAPAGGPGRVPWNRILLEKLPLLALAAVSAALTVSAQAAGGAIHREISLALRLQNALVSLVAYLVKTLWPVRLAVFYPHPADGVAGWRAAGAALLLAAITAAAVRNIRRAPWWLVGWCWYVVSLLPVLGLVQVGGQGLADRYTYLPLIGIFLAIAWSGIRLSLRVANGRIIAAAAGGALLAAWAAGTWVQLGYWKDDVTLFTRALAVTPDNAEARYNLGRGLMQQGRQAEALVQLRRSVELDPRDEHALNDLGIALSRQGSRAEAVTMFRRAILINPAYVDPYLNLAMAHLSQRDARSALAAYRELRAVNPEAARRLSVFLGPAAVE